MLNQAIHPSKMSKSPVRVLIIVSRSSQYWSDTWDFPERISLLALEAVKQAHGFQQDTIGFETQIMLKQRWPLRQFIVFDIGHTDYCAAQGHLPEHNRLQVCIVRFGSKSTSAQLANEGVADRVNKETADAHNLHSDDSAPPFEEDHMHGNYPTYLNPRDPSLL